MNSGLIKRFFLSKTAPIIASNLSAWEPLTVQRTF